jgi:hypothetical protein
MMGRLVGAIPSLPAAVVAPSLRVVLVVIPSLELAVMVVLAVVVRILGTVMAPIPQG